MVYSTAYITILHTKLLQVSVVAIIIFFSECGKNRLRIANISPNGEFLSLSRRIARSVRPIVSRSHEKVTRMAGNSDETDERSFRRKKEGKNVL